MRRIVLAIGSNEGDRRGNLVRALSEISEFASLLAHSMIYETPPEGYAEQRDFLNAAILAETPEDPFSLLRLCKKTEAKLGRKANFRNGPRPIDIDIIFYEGVEIHDELLEIPHPRWSGRDFVLTPLQDLFALPEMSIFEDARAALMSRPKKFRPFGAF